MNIGTVLTITRNLHRKANGISSTMCYVIVIFDVKENYIWPEVSSVRSDKKTTRKNIWIKVVLILLIAVMIFNPISLFLIVFAAEEVTMDFCRDACFIFYKDTVVTQDYVGGMPKADVIGKKADDVSKKYNALLDRYDDNGNLVGRYYDTTFAFFMLTDREDLDKRYFVYAEVGSDSLVTDMVLFDYYRTYEETDEEYLINRYFSEHDRQTSKWEKYNITD